MDEHYEQQNLANSLCGWCSQPILISEIATATDQPDTAKLVSRVMVSQYAIRGDGVMWHPECFVKHLSHLDDIKGIDRTGLKPRG